MNLEKIQKLYPKLDSSQIEFLLALQERYSYLLHLPSSGPKPDYVYEEMRAIEQLHQYYIKAGGFPGLSKN